MKRSPLKRKTPLKAKAPMKRTRKQVPKEIRDHWQRVARLGCMVTFSDMATIHHVHGGSIREFFGAHGMPGAGQKQNDWLVIPLHPRLHTGQDGIDNGMGTTVASWERRYGKQIQFLKQVRHQIIQKHGYDIFERAGIPTGVADGRI